MTSRKLFHDSVVELPAQGGVTAMGLNVHAATLAHQDETMHVSFSLSPDAGLNEELEQRVERGDRLSIAEIRARYGVTRDQAQPLVDWLRANRFVIDKVTPDHTGVYAHALAGAVATALQVDLVRVTSNGLTYTSARNAPSLPDEIAANVRAIGGLQPQRQARKHLRCYEARQAQVDAEGADKGALLGYRVGQIMAAYGAAGLGVKGSGQTIGIIIDAVPSTSDMREFWHLNGVDGDAARIQVVNVNGVALPAPSGEETLDAQWSSGTAPDAVVRIYATGSLLLTDIDNALDAVLADIGSVPGLNQVSMSLGLGETFMAPGEVKTQHAKFLRLAAAGVNVFVSSGDAGSNPDQFGQSPIGPLQPEYESSDPCVVGVGGTTLVLSANGSVVNETGWAGSGGGKSTVFPRPLWQQGSGVNSGSMRLIPDVALAADPDRGACIVLHGHQREMGGTSWSAPTWAGFCALMNAARVKAGKPTLPFLPPLLYSTQGRKCFRDITSGSNGTYDATAGHDLVTGLGVPNVAALLANLP